jgi:hypothetical protein
MTICPDVRDVGVAGSNPATPTSLFPHNSAGCYFGQIALGRKGDSYGDRLTAKGAGPHGIETAAPADKRSRGKRFRQDDSHIYRRPRPSSAFHYLVTAAMLRKRLGGRR